MIASSSQYCLSRNVALALGPALVALLLVASGSDGFPAASPEDAPLPPNELMFAEEDYEDEEANILRERLQSEYGMSLFGVPDNQTGQRVTEWQDGTGINPEELGEYVEGDILFPPSRNGIRLQSARWPGGVIPYYLSPGFTGYDLQNFQRAINSYHSLTCLRFVPYSGRESDYLVITNDNTGCWSAVGRTGGPQQLNLQSPGCTTLVGTIEHELMHAAGFLHEQNRWERDRYVTVHWQNIQSGREANFRPASRESTDDYGIAYDYGSVMHYSANAFSKNGQPTITPKAAGVELLGQRRGFSQGDVEKINRMYKHVCARRSAAPKSPKSPQH
ncbi:hypothetical protein R5R35_007183 [Gryllus longicercus]|uniref:Metalloendopeptidase n=1 Tax=Gryllus longicercus TaxID=2509291 RepID=A0AAN9VKR8_9ORTH